jgi:hypothetical protein
MGRFEWVFPVEESRRPGRQSRDRSEVARARQVQAKRRDGGR